MSPLPPFLPLISSFFFKSRARDMITRYVGQSVNLSLSVFVFLASMGGFCITAPAQMLVIIALPTYTRLG